MCKAHVLRFSCSHGVLMSLETCRHGPCPVLRTTGVKLPQQPTKCYNCQSKVERASVSSAGSSRNSSCRSSQESLTSASTASSPPSSILSKSSQRSAPSYHFISRPSISKTFSFACTKSDHCTTPHYTCLPEFLPHQDHACPPCQLEDFRTRSDQDVVRIAREEYPNLKAEMLVRDGRIRDECLPKPSLEKYVDEKRTEDREMWLHVTRKWTQDLRKSRVLIAEEDGLGLMG